MLAEARTIDEVKHIRDKAAALKLYMRQRGMSLEAQNAAAEIKLRAERRAGELLEEMPKHPAGRPPENRFHDETDSPPAYADLGIQKTQAYRWQQVAKIPEPEFERHVEETKARTSRAESFQRLGGDSVNPLAFAPSIRS